MLLFVLEKMAPCVGIVLESIGLILFFVLEQYWKRIKLMLVYIAFGSGIALARIGLILFCMSFSIENVLEKYWFNIVLYCVLY